MLHYPPSLAAFLAAPQDATRKRTVLVLTKVDIAGPARVDAWTRYLKIKYPDLPVVPVEAYVEKSAGDGAGKRKMHEPFIPSAFRQTLVDTLKATHASLLEPPEKIRAFPDKLKTWKPPVRREVDWNAVMTARGGKVGSVVGGAAAPRPEHTDDHDDPRTEAGHDGGDGDNDNVEPEFLTIGLIGVYIPHHNRYPAR